jgi:hypothetical protein
MLGQRPSTERRRRAAAPTKVSAREASQRVISRLLPPRVPTHRVRCVPLEAGQGMRRCRPIRLVLGTPPGPVIQRPGQFGKVPRGWGVAAGGLQLRQQVRRMHQRVDQGGERMEVAHAGHLVRGHLAARPGQRARQPSFHALHVQQQPLHGSHRHRHMAIWPLAVLLILQPLVL